MPSGKIPRPVRGSIALAVCLSFGLTACGGGGGAGAPATSSNPAPAIPPPVTASNHSPIVALPNPAQTAVDQHPFSYDAAQGGQTFSDPDDDTLAYEIKLGHADNPYSDPNPPKGLRVEGTRIVGAPEETDTVYVTIIASDKLGWTANNQFVVRVMPNGAPAVAIANEDHLIGVGGSVDIDTIDKGAVFADPEGDALSYEVAMRGEPGGLSANGTRVTGTLSTVGLVEITVTARDAYGGVGQDVFLVAAPAAESGVPVSQAAHVYRDEGLPLPANFRQYPQSTAPPHLDTSPADNLTTDAGAALGRVLFYDKRLSITNTVACASCHVQEHGFASPDRFNKGALGLPLKRNAMALANVRYSIHGRWFGDMRTDSLQALVLEPLVNPEELGSPIELTLQKLRAASFYPPLFEAAFGTSQVTSERIARALAQFLQSLISYRAKIDIAVNAMDFGEPGNLASLNATELRGKEIFEGDSGAGIPCNLCHDMQKQSNIWQANNGIDAVPIDPGIRNQALLQGVTSGVFRAASLRNVALTAPYMHDGRFATLRDVINQYDHNVQDSRDANGNPTLDPIMRNTHGAPRSMNLTEADKDALEAFLRTFTDADFLSDPKFSDPFQ